jgi:hypothetical protein
MKMIRFRIKKVDLYGFCGREKHPSQSDEGLTVTPLGMALCHFDVETGAETQMLAANGTCASAKLMAEPDNLIALWRCVTDDGRLLDLVDHEVTIV